MFERETQTGVGMEHSKYCNLQEHHIGNFFSIFNAHLNVVLVYTNQYWYSTRPLISQRQTEHNKDMVQIS